MPVCLQSKRAGDADSVSDVGIAAILGPVDEFVVGVGNARQIYYRSELETFGINISAAVVFAAIWVNSHCVVFVFAGEVFVGSLDRD